MKILPNIKYNGMEFKYGNDIYILKFMNNKYYLKNIRNIYPPKQPVEYSHIVESLKNGYWNRISK